MKSAQVLGDACRAGGDGFPSNVECREISPLRVPAPVVVANVRAFLFAANSLGSTVAIVLFLLEFLGEAVSLSWCGGGSEEQSSGALGGGGRRVLVIDGETRLSCGGEPGLEAIHEFIQVLFGADVGQHRLYIFHVFVCKCTWFIGDGAEHGDGYVQEARSSQRVLLVFTWNEPQIP